jgi:hypothetical protein
MASTFEGLTYGLLNDVLAAFRSDDGTYTTTNRYEIVIGMPKPNSTGGGGLMKIFQPFLRSGLTGYVEGASGLRGLQLRAESVQLPGRNLSTSDDPNIYGPIRTVADGVSFAEDINVTFQCSTELWERKFFEYWQEHCFDKESWNMKYYNDYVGSLSIFLLDKQDKRRFGLKCMECYPKTLVGMDLNYAPATDIAKLTVGFVFRYWEALDINDKGTSLLGRMANTIIDHAERNIMRNVPGVIQKLL